MSFFHSAILGLVEGLTEFIPISSSGHLILARKLLGLPLAGSLSFDAIIQLAAGLAVVVYFWQDIWNILINKNWKLFWTLVISTIPAIILGLLLQKYMDTVFRGTHVVALSLIAGSILFYFAEKHFRKVSVAPAQDLTIKKGLWIGLYQCLALVPGFSRSGATISGGLLNNLDREMAVRFSFLLSLPIIFGSGLYKVYSQVSHGLLGSVESSLIIASIFAFISGLTAIHYLLKFLRHHSLNWFGIYRIILAVVILIFI